VVVLSTGVSDAHLAGLRADGVSYFFAGDAELDLRRTLDILRDELGVERVLLEGGGATNGAFLRAGLVDEISLVIVPAVDGVTGAPTVFDVGEDVAHPLPVRAITLQSSQVLDGGAVWLRYRVDAERVGD
jgi:riboflavin biosynthesis pyrimidine reductase